MNFIHYNDITIAEAAADESNTDVYIEDGYYIIDNITATVFGFCLQAEPPKNTVIILKFNIANEEDEREVRLGFSGMYEVEDVQITKIKIPTTTSLGDIKFTLEMLVE